MTLRKCPRCKQFLPHDNFHLTRDGKPRGKCKPCHAEYCAEYYQRNRQAILASSSARYMASQDRADRAARSAERKSEATKRRKSFRKEYERRPAVVAYRRAYKSRPERRQKTSELSKRPEKLSMRAARARAARASDPKFLISGRMSSLIRRSIRAGKGGVSWRSLVDYSVDELRNHIERQFLPGMSWENSSQWHIDHIIPVSSFDYKSTSDDAFRYCWALTNLRPLWRTQNISKGDRRVFLI